MADTTIRLKALDGTWETCGVDRIPAVVPESVVLDADEWGSKGARFDLKRDPSQVWPDISAFTPVKIDVDNSPSWYGRVSETPSRDGTDMVMSVACEGIQHHLDDDLVERKYVHSNLSEWQDLRAFIGTDIGSGAGQLCAAGQISNSNGGITLMFPKGAVLAGYAKVGVQLDLQTLDARRVVLTWTSSATSGYTLYARMNTSSAIGASVANSTLVAGTSPLSGTASSNQRYVSIFMEVDAAGATPANDVWVTLRSVSVFSDAAYESGNTSNLKASTVIADAVSKGTALLSADTSGITATSFNIPAFAPSEPSTVRDRWQAVNAFHGWMSKVDVDGRPVFQAVPLRPKYQIGEWSAAEITDSSQNSGQDIYNKVIVTGTDPAGQPVRVTRYANAAGYTKPQSDLTCSNPSFDTNTTGWTFGAGSGSRTTTGGEFDSSPGGGKMTVSVNGNCYASFALSGTAVAGRTYLVSARVKGDAAGWTGGLTIGAAANGAGFGPGSWAANGWLFFSSTLGTSFQTISCLWTPQANLASPVISLGASQGLGTMYFDTIQIEQSVGSLPARRGFTRAKQLAVNSVLPSDGVAAAAIGDVWLANHITTPFRGSIVLTGEDSLRNRLSGQPVPLAALLRDTGELLELTDRSDPDTGATTRKGRITTVSYVPALDQATVALDSTRANLDNLLNRLAATG